MNKLIFLAAPFFFVGCVAQNDPRLKKLDELGTTFTSLQTQLERIQSQIESLQNDVLALQSSVAPYETATFDPGNPGGYQRIDTTSGVFLVSVKNVTPYVDGFRVTCNVGNPSSATFSGFKVKAKWGPRRDFKSKGFNFAQWQALLREKELSLTESLRPGAWNPVTFVLSPAKADEFGYLELSLTTDLISLRQ